MSWQGGTPYYQDPNQQYGGYPGGAYPPPQGGYPPTGGYPQGGYPNPQAGYMPPPQQGGFVQPGAGYPGYPPPSGGFAPEPGFIQPPPAGYNSYNGDPEAPKNFSFDDQAIRKAFLRKVYSILMCQLLVTFGFVTLFTFSENSKRFAAQNPWMLWVCFGVTIVLLLAFACCEGARRTFPTNFICLSIFTLAESVLLGFMSARFRSSEVMLAVGITTAVCLALTLFALQTKYDFTAMGGILLAAAVIFMIFGLVAMFWHGKTITLVYSSIGAFLFSVYLIYDTQLMLGGNHKYSISPEEYIFAALNIYLDIIQIFIHILSIIGASRD